MQLSLNLLAIYYHYEIEMFPDSMSKSKLGLVLGK